MAYVFMEWDISFREWFSVLNLNLASVFSQHTINSVNIVNIANILDFNAMRYKKQYNDLPQVPVWKNFMALASASPDCLVSSSGADYKAWSEAGQNCNVFVQSAAKQWINK